MAGVAVSCRIVIPVAGSFRWMMHGDFCKI